MLSLLPMAASQAELPKGQFDSLFALCMPPKSESAWLELGWEIDLWAARERAAKEGKPIFLWEMDGHPLGCT
jgi:hypothetical protein